MKRFWVHCRDCEDSWVALYSCEHGLLFAADDNGETCSDCGGEVEIDDEYTKGSEL